MPGCSAVVEVANEKSEVLAAGAMIVVDSATEFA